MNSVEKNYHIMQAWHSKEALALAAGFALLKWEHLLVDPT